MRIISFYMIIYIVHIFSISAKESLQRCLYVKDFGSFTPFVRLLLLFEGSHPLSEEDFCTMLTSKT